MRIKNGMVDLCEIIGSEIGVPVVDGVTAAVKFVESHRMPAYQQTDFVLVVTKRR